MSLRWILLTAAIALAGARTSAATPATVRPALALPVHDVTVFSDRARVVRRGAVAVARGTQTLQLPLLPATIDPSSVRLEATGAKVLRVLVVRANEGELPRSEAEAVLHELETLTDKARATQDALDAWSGERDFLARLTPAATPGGDATHPPLLLEAAGWASSLDFFDTREAADDAALLPLQQELRDELEQVAEAAARARRLAGGGAGSPGYKVDAVVDASGRSANLSLAYMAMGARWYPTYDVRYDPNAAKVEVSFGGLVSQSTGEDWNDAKLVLSTAIPAATATLPKLSVWKIGQKDRFIPTPAAAWQPPVTPPPPPVPWARPVQADNRSDDELRQALYEAANDVEVRAADTLAGRDMSLGLESDEATGGDIGDSGEEPAPHRAYLPEKPRPMASEPPPPPPSASAPSMPMAPPPAYAMNEEAVGAAATPMMARLSSGEYRPTESVAFGAPRGWQPPYYAEDLPAALAGGYTFVYPAAKPETVPSGGEAHRVALFSRTFPASANVRILPALSKSAYLVTALTNDGDRPMLKGRAHLFVGADLVGDAEVPTTAVGQQVTLPLGVDDAIKIERNVHVLSSEQGFFSKDDVSSYEVVIELVNPHPKLVHAVVEDQVPVAHGEKISVKVDRIDPAATVDKINGLVDWKVDLAPGQKQTLTLRYSLTRPKDWKLTQSTAPTGSNP